MNITEWLNKYIGTDVATYIGVVLGLVSIFYGAKKVLSTRSQKQNVNNGNAIQVGRDFKINK